MLKIILVLLLSACPAYAAGNENPDPASPGAITENTPGYPPVVSYTLKNGLKVLVLERHMTPTISFHIFFKAGSVDDRPWKTGLAHLFEHMAFKGTKTINTSNFVEESKLLDKIDAVAGKIIAAERDTAGNETLVESLRAELKSLEEKADAYIVKDEYQKLYKSLGESDMNAFTSVDYTGYVVSLPSNRLESWMMIESDRFKNPVMREFYRERSVVMEERRMGESTPARVMWEAMVSHAFKAHPYRNPTIGWMSDIKALTRTDADDFYKSFYTPGNAAVAIVGDVDSARVITLMKKYFEDIPSKPITERFYTEEPGSNSESRVKVFFKAQPQMLIAYKNPGEDHPDTPALIMLDAVLSSGRTSRLYKELVEKKQLAVSAGSSYSTPGRRYPSLFIFGIAPRAPHTCEENEKALYSEIEKLKNEPPGQNELEKIRNQLEAEKIQKLETNQGLSQSLAYGQAITGDWKSEWKLLEKLRKVTAEDIVNVTKKYFTDNNRTVIILEQPETGEGTK